MTTILVIIADGEVDSIQQDGPHAVTYIKDLRERGHDMRVKRFDNWRDAEFYEMNMR